MRVGRPFEFPADKAALRARARRVAWLTLALLGTSTVLLALALGQSEAMKTAWVSDLLTLVPPIAYLVAMRYELNPPSKRFPYGYSRAIAISFLVTSAMLTLLGASLLFDAVTKLAAKERPPIGTVELFGHQFWAGWTMIAALSFSVASDMLVGRLKKPVAEGLHDKALEAETRMNADAWMSEGAAIVGILLVGFGQWWGDALAAGIISAGILRDGWHNIRQVIGDLMDEAPSVLGTRDLEDLPARLTEAAERLPWVERAAARLREHGRVLLGEVFVVPRDDVDLTARLSDASHELQRLDWRVHELLVVPVRELMTDPPKTLDG